MYEFTGERLRNNTCEEVREAKEAGLGKGETDLGGVAMGTSVNLFSHSLEKNDTSDMFHKERRTVVTSFVSILNSNWMQTAPRSGHHLRLSSSFWLEPVPREDLSCELFAVDNIVDCC
jgi:hypothetical protein